MQIFERVNLAKELMEKYGLIQKGWTFKIDRAKKRLGCTKYRTKTITLSIHHIKNSPDHVVLDTILHEIAHALVGSGHNHDNIWRQKALEIGCNGKRCADTAEAGLPTGNYQAACNVCETVIAFHRKPKYKTYGHKGCEGKIIFS